MYCFDNVHKMRSRPRPSLRSLFAIFEAVQTMKSDKFCIVPGSSTKQINSTQDNEKSYLFPHVGIQPDLSKRKQNLNQFSQHLSSCSGSFQNKIQFSEANLLFLLWSISFTSDETGVS